MKKCAKSNRSKANVEQIGLSHSYLIILPFLNLRVNKKYKMHTKLVALGQFHFQTLQANEVKSGNSNLLPFLGLPGGGIEHLQDVLILLLSLLCLQPLLCLLLR